MTTYYVDPTATGNNDGSSKANAWTTLQRAIDGTGGTQPSAGDTVLLRHVNATDETPAARIDFDGKSGGSSGVISFVGVNSSWVEDGTQYVIDGTNTPASTSLFCHFSTSNYLVLKNIVNKNSKSNSLLASGNYPTGILYYNCKFIDPAASVLNTYIKYIYFIKCAFISAAGDGLYRPWQGACVFCSFIDNGGDALEYYHPSFSIFGCIMHGNGGRGIVFDCSGTGTTDGLVIANVIDGNTGDGFEVNSGYASGFAVMLANRITNNAKGADIDSGTVFGNWNFFLNNSTAAKEGTILHELDSLTTGTEGYTDRAKNNFNLTSDASLRRTAITIPVS